MANEIALSVNLSVNNGNYSNTFTNNANYNQNALGAAGGIAATTTTAANLDLGSVTTEGFLVLKNLDPTNACDFGISVSSTFHAIVTVQPTEVAVFRLKQGITPQLQAQAGTPNIQYWLLQN